MRGLQTRAGNPADARGRLLARVPLGSAIECLQPGPDHSDRPDLLACKKLAAAHAVDGKDRIGSRQRDSRIVRLVLESRVDQLPSFPTERRRELRSSSTSRVYYGSRRVTVILQPLPKKDTCYPDGPRNRPHTGSQPYTYLTLYDRVRGHSSPSDECPLKLYVATVM